jgi:hypothetical protein
MQLSEIRTLALSYLDDTSGGYFTNATMLQFINKAAREVQKQLLQAGENFYVTAQQTTLVPSQAEYILPADFRKTDRVELVTNGLPPNESKIVLASISLQQQDILSNNAVGTPNAYVLKKNRMILFPTPDQAYVLRLWYSYRIADMVNDTDIPDVPYEYHEYIAVLAAIDGMVKDDRPFTNLATMKADYLTLMKQDAEERTEDGSRHIIETSSDGLGSLF